jgi:hypothetical protein
MKGPGLAGHPLGDDAGFRVNEDAHADPSCSPAKAGVQSKKQRTAR